MREGEELNAVGESKEVVEERRSSSRILVDFVAVAAAEEVLDCS